jgi:hypothetical protein
VYQLQQADYEKLSTKFRNAHSISKHHNSFKDYELLCRLDRAKGLNIGNSYVNDKYCAKFVDSIASVILDSVVSNIKASHFFSITCDSSADFTGDDYETLYVRTCHEGKLNDQFYFIGIPESGSVLSIHDFIVESFFSSGLDMEFETKLVGFCSDGASNMQGK